MKLTLIFIGIIFLIITIYDIIILIKDKKEGKKKNIFDKMFLTISGAMKWCYRNFPFSLYAFILIFCGHFFDLIKINFIPDLIKILSMTFISIAVLIYSIYWVRVKPKLYKIIHMKKSALVIYIILWAAAGYIVGDCLWDIH